MFMPSAITSLPIFQAISCRIRFRVIDGEARRNSAPVLFSLRLRALISAGCSADKSEVCPLDYCSSVKSFCQSVRSGSGKIERDGNELIVLIKFECWELCRLSNLDTVLIKTVLSSLPPSS